MAAVTKTVLTAAVIVSLLVGVGIGYVVAPLVAPPPLPVGLKGDISIGCLAPLTGDLGLYGENSKAALELAAKDVNEFLGKMGAEWRIKLEIEDTGTLPATALEKVTTLHGRGVKLYWGPMASSEVTAIKPYADANGLLAFSPSSTSPALSIADDYIYRICPNDLIQGPAIARLMWDAGVRYAVPVWRGDSWGDGLKDATEKRFKELGGTFSGEVVRYVTPPPKEFTLEATTLADIVGKAVAEQGAEKVGVLFIAFGEFTTFFMDAKKHDVLWDVRWFGSDGTCLYPGATEPEVGELAAGVKFVNTIYAPSFSPKYMKVKDYCEKTLGRTPDCYVYGSYDIVWIYSLCLMATDKYDADAVMEVLPDITKSYFGASGWPMLSPEGDRATSDYELYAILELTPGKFEWAKVGLYVSAGDTISWAIPL